MRIKKHLLCLLSLSCFLTGLNSVRGQETEVADIPEEIRVLPNSFKENYKGEAYNYVESISFWDKIKTWVLDKIISWFSITDASATTIWENLSFLFYAVVILGVVYFIIKIILNKEGRWLFKRKTEEVNDLSYDIGEHIREVNFDTLIAESVASKDYRSAIRYSYLLVLKKLDQFDIITYDTQKTAYDYQTELEGSKYAIGFNKATYYYTYIWYGEFVIDEAEYKNTSAVYAQLLKQFEDA
ncbi:MAG: hypothetical protein QM485_05100 [Flavobacteriaceae bacterium]